MNKTKNMRFTRHSYKRKLVIFGVSIFMSIALSATGFAAWVISKDTKKQLEGSVEIGAVTEASVEITDMSFIGTENDKNFRFEPLENDTSGRVRYDGNSLPENLDVEFTWKIKNYQIVSDVFVEFKLPSTVYDAVERDWIALPNGFEMSAPEEIDDKEYTVLKYRIQDPKNPDDPKPKITNSGSTTDGILSYEVTKDETTGLAKEVVFTMKIAFEWGEAFKGDNPGIYYDKAYADDIIAGENVPYETVKATLNEFKATLHGITYNEEFEAKSEEAKANDYVDNPIGKYYIVINATVA